MKTDGKSSQTALNVDSKNLVVYFSHACESYNVGYIEKQISLPHKKMLNVGCMVLE